MNSNSRRWRLTERQENVYSQFASLSLPRHTSYPAVPAWGDEISSAVFDGQVDLLAASDAPVSLYVHIPFCEKLCSYCACNRLILGQKSEHATFARVFLDKVGQEIAHNLGRKKTKWRVAQLHLGGGTPTFLTPEQLGELMGFITPFVEFTPDAELAVELDPRVTTTAHLELLRQSGFNRVSLGIQDFDPKVQVAVDRIQSFAMIEDFFAECRRLGFASINFDLIYGLPLQTLETVQHTLRQVVNLGPDRIAFYRLALIPEVFKWQRTFSREQIPHGQELLTMLLNAIDFLTASGYAFVGLDHFVKPTEALYKATEEKTMRRSFQGMTTGAELPILAFGPSAISSFPQAFMQRPTDFYKWNKASLNTVKKGMLLTKEDLLHRWVIESIYCYRRLDKRQFKELFGQEFDGYFHDRRAALEELAELGLVTLQPDAIEVTAPLGMLLLRVIASVFDAYLPKDAYKHGLEETHASKIG